MSGSSHRRGGFTLVEVLVVIGVITLLAGILLPALAGARKRARKAEETSLLRQVGVGWNLYATSNNDYALPGYLDTDTQETWKVRYKFLDKTDVEPATAAPWVWRLMPHLSYNHEIMHGYLDETDPSAMAMIEEADEVAESPAFGYNAYYVGGWWTQPDSGIRPKPRFMDAERDGRRVNVIVRSPSDIRDSAKLILFCASTEVSPGVYEKFNDYQPGAHWVTPPWLADQPNWREYGDSPDDPIGEGHGIKALTTTTIPMGRYTNQAAALHADMHIEPHEAKSLSDQRYWINGADDRRYKHDE